MKKVYTAFSFNGVVYTDLINASLDNSMHSEDMRGNRTLLKEKIPGRDIPYFYAVEDEALEFDVVFALTTPKTKAELKVIMRNLITQTGYKELHFGDYNPTTLTMTNYIGNGTTTVTGTSASSYTVGDMITISGATGTEQSKLNGSWIINSILSSTTFTFVINSTLAAGTYTTNLGTTLKTYSRKSPIYKVIFDGESKLDFVGANVYNEGVATLKYFGYFTLKACADRPYGYENLTGTMSGVATANLNNPGDLPVFPNIVITNGATAYNVPVRIFNNANSTSVGFTSLAAAVSPSLIGEVITINADLKTISSTTAGVYDRWQRNDLKLEIGNNEIRLQQYTGSPAAWENITTNFWTVVFTVQTPTFIKE
jgi:hypothetical protein